MSQRHLDKSFRTSRKVWARRVGNVPSLPEPVAPINPRCLERGVIGVAKRTRCLKKGMRPVRRLCRFPPIKKLYYELLALGIEVVQEVVVAEGDDIDIPRIWFSLDEGAVYPLRCNDPSFDSFFPKPKEAVADRLPRSALRKQIHEMSPKSRLVTRINPIR